jgi:hypothetical protein
MSKEKTIEERALELYPDLTGVEVSKGFAYPQQAIREYQRHAYIKGATDNQTK